MTPVYVSNTRLHVVPRRPALKKARQKAASLRPLRLRPSLSVKAKSPAKTPENVAKPEVETKPVKEYAVLHDFCMTIPYGGVVSVLGLVGLVIGQGALAGVTALGGIAVCIASALSLRAWRAAESNVRYTLAASGLALGVGAVSWRSVQTVGSIIAKLLVALSAAMVVFLVYNISAGGNPPKRAH